MYYSKKKKVLGEAAFSGRKFYFWSQPVKIAQKSFFLFYSYISIYVYVCVFKLMN